MKINLDSFFKTKLNEVSFEYKPEYWEEMKQQLEKEGGSGTSGGGFFSGGSFFNWYKIAFIVSIVIIIGGILFYLGESSDNPVDEKIENQNTPVQTIATDNVSESSDVNASGIADDEIVTSETKVVKKIKARSYRKRTIIEAEICVFRPSVMEDINERMIKDAEIRMLNNFTPYDIGKPEYDMGEEVIIPAKPSVVNGNETGEAPKKVKQPDKPKDYKPMQKPVKHVFGKKRGLLYRLGLRK